MIQKLLNFSYHVNYIIGRIILNDATNLLHTIYAYYILYMQQSFIVVDDRFVAAYK